MLVKYNEACHLLSTANSICKEYNWLLNSYVSDFYVNKHWDTLPNSWREVLELTDLQTLASIIDVNNPVLRSKTVLPLSFLVLRVLIKHTQIVRRQALPPDIVKNIVLENQVLKVNKKIFWKHVKLKKRHEIEIMSEISYKMAVQTKCYFIVDIGSGLGHLIRLLSLGYGLNVCGLEAQNKLTLQARNLDKEMANLLNLDVSSTHLNINVKTNSDGSDIIKLLEDTFGKGCNFGLVGLHPCGDLAVTLLQLFVKYPQVKFINVVGCCYMKLNTSIHNFGYPVSTFCKKMGFSLAYGSLEVACHALEMYIKKLRSNKCDQLKIHSYRAALEKLVTQKFPNLSHCQVGSVKYEDSLSFSEYVYKATCKMDINMDNVEVESAEIQSDLQCWKHVVSFYSLRLMLAPLIEMIILLDRALFILEFGHPSYITPAFDPNISPRNFVISAIRD